jgi:hypothetical protein
MLDSGALQADKRAIIVIAKNKDILGRENESLPSNLQLEVLPL